MTDVPTAIKVILFVAAPLFAILTAVLIKQVIGLIRERDMLDLAAIGVVLAVCAAGLTALTTWAATDVIGLWT